MKDTIRPTVALSLMLLLACLLPLTARGQTANQQLEEAQRLKEQADQAMQAGRNDEAIGLLERALAIREKAQGREAADVIEVVDGLAQLYYSKGDYQRAETLCLRALAAYEKYLGADSAKVAETLNYLAELYRVQGDFVHALPLQQRALAIREKVLGTKHPDVAQSLNNLALLYQATGNYARTLPLYQRALEMWEKAYGPEHPDVAIALNNLAGLYRATGDYAKALPLLQRALKIQEKVLPPEHPYVATALNNLAELYRATADYAKALPLYQRALKMWEKALGPEHPNVATALNNLGLLYYTTGDYAKAAPLFQRALEIREKALPPEHPDVALALNNLAGLYQHTGDNRQALSLFQRALAIREKALGPEHPDVAQSLNNLAELYRTTGDYASALPLYQRTLAMWKRALGPEHPDVAQTLTNLVVLYQAQGDYAQAVSFMQNANKVREKNLAALLSSGSQQQKQLYLNTLSGETYATVSLHAQGVPQNADAARLALTTILRRKGRALDAFAGQLEALRQRTQPDDKTLLDDLAAAQTQLANLQLGNSKLAPDALRAEVARLTAEQERLEDAISRRSAEFRALTQPVTLERVQAAFPPNAALVELFVYQPFNAKAKPAEQYGAARYVAYVLRPKDAAPQFADLGPAAEIDADATRFHTAVQSPKTPDANLKQLARTLDERVMRPVRKLLGETRRVFLSPDSALNLVSFAAFVDENGKYLVENYSFNYLTSGRDLLRLQIPGQSQDAPTVLANPLFDLKRQSIATTARRELGLWGGADADKVEYRGLDFTTFYYAPLPGTAGEAQALGALWPQARVWTEAAATEAALKAVNRPRLLHIATHGFFFPDQPAEKPDGRGFGLLADNAAPRANLRENPMLRSGLILAGVNQRQSGPDNDGVLTAQETAGLNLFGTKLVVLSACETGLGEVQNGQGVYGLRRALVLAGSETQIMSLWKVSDAATRDLMTAYYTRLQRGEGRSEAMRQVQLEMLRSGKLAPLAGESRKIEQEAGKGKTGATDWRHPYYWASFIQSGAWTSLEGK